MAFSTLFGAFLVASVLSSCLAVSVQIQAEDHAQGYDANRTIDRSNARGNGNEKLNLHLFAGESIEVQFCVLVDDVFSIENFYYSNDGEADVYSFLLDGELIGNVTSTSNTNEGENWNVIETAENIVEPVEITAGPHTLTIAVESAETDDGYGAELDMMTLNFEDDANSVIDCGSSSTSGSTTESEQTTDSSTDSSTDGTTGSTTQGGDCDGEDC